MVVALGVLMGLILADFQEVKLVGVVQGAAVIAIVLNMTALAAAHAGLKD